jgi:hypothetical protein
MYHTIYDIQWKNKAAYVMYLSSAVWPVGGFTWKCHYVAIATESEDKNHFVRAWPLLLQRVKANKEKERIKGIDRKKRSKESITEKADLEG